MLVWQGVSGRGLWLQADGALEGAAGPVCQLAVWHQMRSCCPSDPAGTVPIPHRLPRAWPNSSSRHGCGSEGGRGCWAATRGGRKPSAAHQHSMRRLCGCLGTAAAAAALSKTTATLQPGPHLFQHLLAVLHVGINPQAREGVVVRTARWPGREQRGEVQGGMCSRRRKPARQLHTSPCDPPQGAYVQPWAHPLTRPSWWATGAPPQSRSWADCCC